MPVASVAFVRAYAAIESTVLPYHIPDRPQTPAWPVKRGTYHCTYLTRAEKSTTGNQGSRANWSMVSRCLGQRRSQNRLLRAAISYDLRDRCAAHEGYHSQSHLPDNPSMPFLQSWGNAGAPSWSPDIMRFRGDKVSSDKAVTDLSRTNQIKARPFSSSLSIQQSSQHRLAYLQHSTTQPT